MMEVTASDPRVKALATVAGNYIDKENIVGFIGGEETWKERVARGDAAKEKFLKSGEVCCPPMPKQPNLQRSWGPPPPPPPRPPADSPQE